MRRQVPLERWRGITPSDRGLGAREVAERLRLYGPNEIIEIARNRWLELGRDTASDPMLWFLLAVGALYLWLGKSTEGTTLLAAILPLVGMDAFLHWRTQASTAGLKSRLAARAVVMRDGVRTEIPATGLVPGDSIVVGPSELIPADGIVVAGDDLQAEESTLTGESFPVRKRPLTVALADGSEPAVEGEHWVFAGTRLLTGSATVRVVFTGGETLYGEIVRSAATGAVARTPLQRALTNLVSILLGAAALSCVILAAVRLYQGHGWADAIVSALTLAVAALPDEFPVVFTFFLAMGVYRLAKQQTLVRRAVTVENIGRVTSICSDKTGTITAGRLRLTHLIAGDGVTDEWLLFVAGAASRRESGEPLDGAIMTAIEEAAQRRSSAPQPLATFPFTEVRKRECAIVRMSDGRLLAAAKGAAEGVLASCSLSDHDRAQWDGRVSELCADGHRVIAAAWRFLSDGASTVAEPLDGYSFAGLLAFEDPVREGVPDAVAACRNAGIRVVMVTGDHPLTARAVAREIGLGGADPCVISGDELEHRLAEPGAQESFDVVARALPAQKLALVRVLQRRGEVVAVTGDGVNDVPALQAADVGIAMGERGTRSAREAASIVLMDDNFRTVVRAIGEGRALLRNLRRSFEYLLIMHTPFILSAAIVPLAGFPLMYEPIHIVWIELILHPTALLVFQELPSHGPLEHLASRHSHRLFDARDWIGILGAGATGTVAVLLNYWLSLGLDRDLAQARSVGLVTLTLISGVLAIALSGLRSPTSRLIAATTFLLSFVLVETAPLAALMQLEGLSAHEWARAILGAILTGLVAVLFGRPSRD